MRTFVTLFAAALLAACGGGYLPPISEGRAPAHAPTGDPAAQWLMQAPRGYDTGQGRMVAVHTNSAIGGAMFFESVPRDGVSMSDFTVRACERLTVPGNEPYQECDYAWGDDRRSQTASLSVRGKSAMIVVHRMLGDRSRFMVCTGSWTTPGPTDTVAELNGLNVARLKSYCAQYAGY